MAKAENHPLFDKKGLRRFQSLTETGEVDDMYLLAAIARNSEYTKIVGGQEASDNLLDNPIVFQSQDVLHLYTHFLLQTPGAIRETEFERVSTSKGQAFCENLLQYVDEDPHVAVPKFRPSFRFSSMKQKEQLQDIYMQRPLCLESLSLANVFENYEIVTVRYNQKNYDEHILLRSDDDGVNGNKRKQICKPISMNGDTVDLRRIVTVPMRGPADDSSPYFAAAALALHCPFRSPNNLLRDFSLVEKLDCLLNDAENKVDLVQYVRRCHELADSFRFKATTSINTTGLDGLVSKCDVSGEQQSSVSSQINDDSESEQQKPEMSEAQKNALAELDSCTREGLSHDIFQVKKVWENAICIPLGYEVQREAYREYVNDCKMFGLTYASRKLHNVLDGQLTLGNTYEINTSVSNLCIEDDDTSQTDRIQVMRFKEELLRAARTIDQKHWMKAVFSYLQVYYSDIPETIPTKLLKVCRRNPVIITNAAGGTGKSWLLSKLEEFMNFAIQEHRLPAFCTDPQAQELNNTMSDKPYFQKGRFGRVVI